MGRQSSKRQISCQFCRARKLRCNREFPCTNCTTRGVACRQYQATRRVERTASKNSVDKPGDSNILSRLEKLEAIFQARGCQLESGHVGSAQQSSTSSTSAAPPCSEQPLPPKVQNLTNIAFVLEQSCIGSKISDSAFSDDIVFRTCPIRLVTQLPSYIFGSSNGSSAFSQAEPTRCIWLPNRDETEILVKKYIADINPIHHLVHGPSLLKLITEVYDCLQLCMQVSFGSMFLIVSICAEVVYSWTAQDVETLFPNFSEANAQAVLWIKTSFDLLEKSQRDAHNSLECVQGLAILSTSIFNFEGVSSRARSVLYRAIVMSRELGFHRLDCPQKETSLEQVPPADGIKDEISRRVWWYLVGIDWMLARFPGPQEGTYLIRPEHMMVRKPHNVDDEELLENKELVSRPIDQPTSMSYFILRIRLVELLRTFTDQMSLTKFDSAETEYDKILQLDAAIDSYLLRDVPPFLAMEPPGLRDHSANDPRRSRRAMIHRYILNLSVNGQRCRLHLPYLARGTINSVYAHSRDACLRSARLIIKGEQLLEKEDVYFASRRHRLAVVMHSILLAAIVLLFDLCLASDSGDKITRQNEIELAWKILEGAPTQSHHIVRGKEILRQVVQKYNIPFPMVNRSDSRSMATNGQQAAPNSTESLVANTDVPVDKAKSHYIRRQPEERTVGNDLDSIDWDHIFWGLDVPLI